MESVVVQSVLGAFKAAGAGRSSCNYISTAITTGAEYYRARDRNGGATLSPSDMRVLQSANEQASREVERALRLASPSSVVVNPAEFAMSRFGWGQDDYLQVWFAFIREFKPSIVLGHEWTTSSGARAEVQLALDLGLRFRWSDGSAAAVEEVVRHAQDGLSAFRASGWDRYATLPDVIWLGNMSEARSIRA